jgi:hypothetical protein
MRQGQQRRFVRGRRRGNSRGGMFGNDDRANLQRPPLFNAFPRHQQYHQQQQQQGLFAPFPNHGPPHQPYRFGQSLAPGPNLAFPPPPPPGPGGSSFGNFFRPPDPSVMANIFSQPPPHMPRPGLAGGPPRWRFPWQNQQNGQT